jgi:uncharacterized Fe-S cluster protein YjdI
MSDTEHTYTNGEITVVWKPHVCTHSAICTRGLHQVFNPHARPSVNKAAATTDQIAAQVQKCPSSALRFFRNDEAKH